MAAPGHDALWHLGQAEHQLELVKSRLATVRAVPPAAALAQLDVARAHIELGRALNQIEWNQQLQQAAKGEQQ